VAGAAIAQRVGTPIVGVQGVVSGASEQPVSPRLAVQLVAARAAYERDLLLAVDQAQPRPAPIKPKPTPRT
jgi:hypothetical protein